MVSSFSTAASRAIHRARFAPYGLPPTFPGARWVAQPGTEDGLHLTFEETHAKEWDDVDIALEGLLGGSG